MRNAKERKAPERPAGFSPPTLPMMMGKKEGFDTTLSYQRWES